MRVYLELRARGGAGNNSVGEGLYGLVYFWLRRYVQRVRASAPFLAVPRAGRARAPLETRIMSAARSSSNFIFPSVHGRARCYPGRARSHVCRARAVSLCSRPTRRIFARGFLFPSFYPSFGRAFLLGFGKIKRLGQLVRDYTSSGCYERSGGIFLCDALQISGGHSVTRRLPMRTRALWDFLLEYSFFLGSASLHFEAVYTVL